jgi:hypothetical protein
MNAKTAAIWSVILALGTVIGWTISITTKVSQFATVDRVDAVASGQLAVDRQVLAQFTAVDVAIAKLETGQKAQEKENDNTHAELKSAIEKLREASPRIVAGR